MSIESGYSIGSYDRDKLSSVIELRRASDGEKYEAIGKAEVNVENLPVLFDEIGAFGNPTSDSKRAMIQNGKRNVSSFIYAFHSEKEEIEGWLKTYQELLERYTNAVGITFEVI